MAKIILILIVALSLEAVGVVLLRKGLEQVDKQMSLVQKPFFPRVAHAIGLGIRKWTSFVGIVFEAAFFAGLLYLLSQQDVSVVWPLTALGFVITTFSAKVFLHENVPALRWGGVCLIVLGAAFITWSEQRSKSAEAQNPPPVSAESGAH